MNLDFKLSKYLRSGLAAFLLIGFMASSQVYGAYPGGEVIIKVKGLVCDYCAQSIEKVFENREEIDKVHVDLDKNEIRLAFHAGKAIDDAHLHMMVKDAGFTIESIDHKR